MLSSDAIASGQLFLGKLILEVFGGAGAVWGFSEAIGWRTEATLFVWQPVCEWFGLLFLLRWMWQLKEHLDHLQPNHTPTTPTSTPVKAAASPHEEKNVRLFLCTFSVKLILEVMGATGAVWGFAEALRLRTLETQELWRLCALCTGSVFFVRYCSDMKDYLHEMKYGPLQPIKTSRMVQFYQIFPARLILQVFGGGGAIWGFSELVGLRVSETQAFWRINALLSAFSFGMRFLGEIHDHFVDDTEEHASKETVVAAIQAARTIEVVEAGADAVVAPPPIMTPRSFESYRKNYGTQSMTPETLEISVDSSSFDYDDEEGFARSPSQDEWAARRGDVEDVRDPLASSAIESFPYDERDGLLSPPRHEVRYQDERQDSIYTETRESREGLDEREAMYTWDEQRAARKLVFNQWSSSRNEVAYEPSAIHKKSINETDEERIPMLQ